MSFRKLITTPEEQNKELKKRLEDEINNTEIKGAHKKIIFTNAHIEDPEKNNTFNSLKKAQENKKTLSAKMYATAHVVNTRLNKVEDTRKVFLGNVPIKSKLNTFMVNGSHYVIPHQFRLKPSGYTMLKNNGDVETLFNTNGGVNIKVHSPQDKDELWVNIGNRKFNAYDMLKILGKNDNEIKKELGNDVYENLKRKSDISKTAKSLSEVINVVDKSKADTPDGLKMIKEELTKGKLDKEATKSTLGVDESNFNANTLLASIKKVIDVKKGKKEPDDKENLKYKKIMTPTDLIVEGAKKNIQKNIFKTKSKLNSFNKINVTDVIKEPVVGKSVQSFITTSAISRMPEGYNPLQIQQVNADITPLGEGGVKSNEVITNSMRALHLSQAGFIDPIKSPEGANTGITLSLTENSMVDKDGNPAMLVRNVKTGKLEIKRVDELWDKKLAFPDVDDKGNVGIRVNGNIVNGKIKDADYQIPDHSLMYGPAMNSMGLIRSNDPTRNLMGSKHITQALPIVDRDLPAVSLKDSTGSSMLKHYGKQTLPIASVDGVITKIDNNNGIIEIKDKNGNKNKIAFASEKLPLNSKTFLSHELKVKVGDVVKKGDILADSNYTKDGKYALGKNLRVTFQLYPGTRNDAFVLSESAAKKLTSLHSHLTDVQQNKDIEVNKQKFITLFPELAKKIDLNKYDDNGFLKKGVTVHKGEPLYLGIKKMDQEEVKFANDKVKKMLYGGYSPYIEEWKKPDSAKVENISHNGKNSRIMLTYKSPLREGDKIAGRSGNKGIVSKILPDHEMPRDENGNHIEAILGGAGVASRQNPAQIIEAALGEVAKKTGKHYEVEHFDNKDIAEFAEQEAKKHNVKLYHKLYDPIRKEYIKQPVFVGTYHVQKLFKQGDAAWSAIGHGPADGLDQPKKGGKESASSISAMEVNALLAHNAKDFLRETFNIRSQKNREWFSAFMRGESILPKPEDKTSLKKFESLLNQMHIRVDDDGKNIKLSPMTDADVIKMSNGEVKEPFGIKHGNLSNVKGGFYDPNIFGGNGTMYGHIDLGTKIINPHYAEVVARALRMTPKQLNEKIKSGEIEDILKRVSKINLDELEKEVKKEIQKSNNASTINNNIKLLKAIKKLKSENKTLHQVASISKIPVIPTKFRPLSKLPNGTIVDHDINQHYATIISAAKSYKDAKKQFGENHTISKALRGELQQHIGALYGTNESPDPVLKKREVKSVASIIAGKKPKESLWQTNVLSNKVYTSGRSVIIPKEQYLHMDEVELPKNIAWKVFEPHVKREMAKTGMDNLTIEKHLEDKSPVAKSFLDNVMKQVPVVINRAPSLHKHNITGHWAKIGTGDAMKISPLVENGHNADYDGDQLAIHVPLTSSAIHDVKNKLMASKQLFGERNKDNLIMSIDLDPFVGYYHATKYHHKKQSK